MKKHLGKNGSQKQPLTRRLGPEKVMNTKLNLFDVKENKIKTESPKLILVGNNNKQSHKNVSKLYIINFLASSLLNTCQSKKFTFDQGLYEPS